MKEEIGLLLEKERERLCSMSDAIFDRPEISASTTPFPRDTPADIRCRVPRLWGRPLS